jgi:2-methylcitrate dehydratase PrpD
MTETVSRRLADYLADAADRPLPEDVTAKTAVHLLDTVVAGISGSRLAAGVRGREYAARFGSPGPVALWGHAATTDAQTAALVNGMASHADETDDSHAPSVSHPGCGVVPAALALAGEQGISGKHLLRAVAAGYDVGTRINMAIAPGEFGDRKGAQSTHARASLFGAVAASAVVLRLDADRAMTALSYGTQLSSGVITWLRDRAHVEKAFVFAGMPTRNGVFAATIAAAGWEGVPDPFDLAPSFFGQYAGARPEVLVDGLGERYEIMETNIKKYAVGSPAQAAVQAMEDLVREHELTATEVDAIEILLPSNASHVVDNRDMPDVCVQYLTVGTLLDGGFSFAMAHDEERMGDADVRALRAVTTLTPDESTAGTRAGTVQVRTKDGRSLRAHVADVRGTAQNPMTEEEVRAKSADLLEPVLGKERTTELVDRVLDPAGIDAAALAELTRIP